MKELKNNRSRVNIDYNLKIDMMKRYILVIIIISFCLGYSCSENEDLTPSLADEDRLEQLIDASNEDIMAFKEKYGTYILYEFDQMKDFAYQFDQAQTWRDAKITKLQKEDVQTAVDFLKEYFWSCYADSLICNYFPRKCLIVSKIQATVLGISGNDANLSYHDAAANMNSYTAANLDAVSLAEMDEERKIEYIRQLHYIYLVGYLVDVRRNIFVSDLFFDPSNSLYGTKIDRNSSSELDEQFFMNNGFFYLDENTNYYPEKLEDLMSFMKELIMMDEMMRDKILNNVLMRTKMENVVQGLNTIGVDIVKINSLAEDFL